MRELGLGATSAGAIRIVRHRAEELRLDTSHFRGMRRWTDGQLRDAITGSRTWDEAIAKLGLSANSGNIRPFIKSHAVRLGLEYSHLVSRSATETHSPVAGAWLQQGQLRHLRDAGGAIAAAWFTLCGCTVSFPIEPAIYDLLVAFPDGIKRVQVKTSTSDAGYGWQACVGHRPYTTMDLGPVAPYDPHDIDYFFIIDGDLAMYLIPCRVIAGHAGILLSAYQDYIVGDARGLMTLAA